MKNLKISAAIAAFFVLMWVFFGGLLDEPKEVLRASRIQRTINSDLYMGVYLDYVYLSENGEIVVHISSKDLLGSDYYFDVDKIIIDGDCSVDTSDFELFANTANGYDSPPGYLYGTYSTYDGELFVNYTEIVGFSLRDGVISMEINEDAHYYPTPGNTEAPTAISELCAKG